MSIPSFVNFCYISSVSVLNWYEKLVLLCPFQVKSLRWVVKMGFHDIKMEQASDPTSEHAFDVPWMAGNCEIDCRK